MYGLCKSKANTEKSADLLALETKMESDDIEVSQKLNKICPLTPIVYNIQHTIIK